MIKYALMFVFSVFSLITYSLNVNANNLKNNASISGSLLDECNNTVVDNAIVTVSENGKVLAKTIANEDGTFKIENLPHRKLQVTFENLAHATYTKTVDFINEKQVNLGKVFLTEQATILEDLIILVRK